MLVCDQIQFTGHAIRRMFERAINIAEMKRVIQTGEIIADYPNDQPFPSRLMLGFVADRPLHVVVSVEQQSGTCYIITAYDPDPELWDADLKARRFS